MRILIGRAGADLFGRADRRSTLATVRLGGETIVVRAEEDFDRRIDSDVHIRVDPAKTYLFDAESEQRIRV